MLMPVSESGRTGIQVESHDTGPGIQNVHEALADGDTTSGSLGYGLGSVNRLMDSFDITSKREPPDNGTHIICRRFRRLPTSIMSPGPLTFGVATRAHPLMTVNGDTFVIKQWGTSALVGIIDGLGHGQGAQTAAQTARQYVENHYDQPLTAIFQGTGRACQATRGVVMALARFDWPTSLAAVTLSFCSIGNIEVRVLGRYEPMNFVIRRGVLGGSSPTPVVTEHIWSPDNVMILHSDGISSHWTALNLSELIRTPAPAIAQRLVRELASETDDATVLVVQRKTDK